MNILYIEHYAGSDKYGMEFRPFYMAREWVKMGHSVTILGADFSHLRKKNPVIQKDFTEEWDSGVRFVWLKSNRYRRNDHMRVFNMLGFVKKIKKHAQYIADTYKPDVIIHSSTYPMDVYAAQAVKAYCNAPCFYEIHDLWPMSLLAMAPIIKESNPIIRYVQKAEDACYQLDDGVISILPGANRHIKERGFTVNYHNVPNGIVLGDQPDPTPLSEETLHLFEQWKQQGKFIVLYAGGHARSNALDCLIEAADLVDASVHLVLVGKGDQKERLMELAKKKENITFLPPVEKRQIPTLLSLADALYLGAKNDPLYEYGVGMNKIFDYMLAKKPVINGIKSEGNPLELSGCALTVAPEQATDLAEGIKKLQQMSQTTRDEMGQKGYDYVIKHHDYTVLAEKFIDAFNTVK
jgi:glycosyltransferase involved in cell wall biosynthesis